VQPGAALYGPPAARPAKKPKTLRVILFCLLGAALLGAGVYFGFFYRGGLLNSGPERAGKEIEALFEDFTAALKAGDYEAVEACLTPDLLARADGNMEDLIDTVAIFNNATLTLDDLSVADDEVSAVGTMAMTMNVLVELSAFYEVRFEKIETRWLIAEVVLLNSNFPFEDGFSFGEDFPFEDIFPFESFEGFEDFGPSFAEPETEVPVVHGG
jgi:predicted TIM-barrel fold metal-dependent hydrolase